MISTTPQPNINQARTKTTILIFHQFHFTNYLKWLQSWTKGWRQIDEIKQNRFFYGMFYSWFFTKKCQNLALGWTAGYSPSNPSISGIFWKLPNFLGLKSFGNSWGDSWTYFLPYFLVIIIEFRFTCGEVKLCEKLKKSANIWSKIVVTS